MYIWILLSMGILQLTDKQLDWICKRIPNAPRSAKGGRPPADKRKMVRVIFWILDNGAKWKDLPAAFGPKSTVHDWFHRWAEAGVFERIMRQAGRCVEVPCPVRELHPPSYTVQDRPWIVR